MCRAGTGVDWNTHCDFNLSKVGPVFSGFDSPRAPYYPIMLFLRTSYLGDFIGTFVVTTWPRHGHGQQVLTRIRMGIFKIQVNWMNEPKNASSFIYNK